MIRNLKVLGLAMGAVLAMSAIASSSASAAPEFTCAEGGVHKSCKFKATTEPNSSETFLAAAPVHCHNTYEGSDADGTATKITVTNTQVLRPFDAPEGATKTVGCEATVGGVRFAADVDFQGCGYEFHAKTKLAANEYTALVDIVCPAEKFIDIKITTAAGGTKCTLKVFPQKELGHVILKNTVNPGTGKEDVTANATVEGITYTSEIGGLLGCGVANGVHEKAAKYTGNVTVEAFNTEGKAIDGTVAGE